MSKIRVLPDSLANKIAAGEVVERPASVVKELLENALDAGATRIDIEIDAGGKRLIRVIDDGEGMTRDDAITAFERHATSKLRTAEDLDAITTLGFRGEALPSIAAVSRLVLRTKSAADAEGTEIDFNGGKLLAVRDIAWPGGTELEVKDLFFNVPARRKFLKSESTESFHITNLVQHYALANPGIAFLLINNGREAIGAVAVQSVRERAYQILGGPLLEKLVEVKSEAEGLRVSGFASNPQEQRSSRDAQYLFVNGRFVRDQLIGRALGEAYRSMMPSGTYPAAVLFIEAPPFEVDVNVHPAKTEVRFLHENAVLSFVRTAIADALRATQPVTRLPEQPRARGQRWQAEPGASNPFQEAILEAHVRASSSVDRVAAQRQVSTSGTDEQAPDEAFLLQPPAQPGSSASQRSLDLSYRAVSSDSGGADFSDISHQLTQSFEQEVGVPGTCGDAMSEFSGSARGTHPLPGLGHGIKPLGQIRDSYIVATDEEGLLLVDQHVAHERVLFEQFRDQRLARAVEVQPLLIPETLDLSPAEANAFEAVHEELEGAGIETGQLSGRTIAIKSAPSGLAASDVIALVREVLGVVERARRSFSLEDIRDEIAAQLACKAAIKVNMPLTPEKMQWLIDELMKTHNPMTCPHGRPIIMRFGLRDIERGFKRPV